MEKPGLLYIFWVSLCTAYVLDGRGFILLRTTVEQLCEQYSMEFWPPIFMSVSGIMKLVKFQNSFFPICWEQLALHTNNCSVNRPNIYFCNLKIQKDPKFLCGSSSYWSSLLISIVASKLDNSIEISYLGLLTVVGWRLGLQSSYIIASHSTLHFQLSRHHCFIFIFFWHWLFIQNISIHKRSLMLTMQFIIHMTFFFSIIS